MSRLTGRDALIARKERLSRAVRWLDQQPSDRHATVDEACRRFDLSPSDEELLLDLWRRRAGSGSPEGEPG